MRYDDKLTEPALPLRGHGNSESLGSSLCSSLSFKFCVVHCSARFESAPGFRRMREKVRHFCSKFGASVANQIINQVLHCPPWGFITCYHPNEFAWAKPC